LWDELQAGKEIFAYVKNKTKLGDFYWVLAFVTPTKNNKGEVIEYFSVRRKPKKEIVSHIIEPLYRELLSLERGNGMAASQKHLQSILEQKGLSYEQFIFSL
jgi:hypothetical protein